MKEAEQGPLAGSGRYRACVTAQSEGAIDWWGRW